MVTYKPWLKWKKVPFCACGFKDFMGIDAEAVENHGKFVDESNVDVALRVFDDLGGFGYFY